MLTTLCTCGGGLLWIRISKLILIHGIEPVNCINFLDVHLSVLGILPD